MPYLIEMLEDEEIRVREHALGDLHPMTFTSFDLPAQTPAERARLVVAWQQWWQANQHKSLCRGTALAGAQDAPGCSTRPDSRPAAPAARFQPAVFIASRTLHDLTGHDVFEYGMTFHSDKKWRDKIVKQWEDWWQKQGRAVPRAARKESLPAYVPREHRVKNARNLDEEIKELAKGLGTETWSVGCGPLVRLLFGGLASARIR